MENSVSSREHENRGRIRSGFVDVSGDVDYLLREAGSTFVGTL